MFKGNNK
jgi:hypothetical protein